MRRRARDRGFPARSGRDETGFTFVEILIALAVGAIVIVGMYRGFNILHKWFVSSGIGSEMRQNARVGLETVTRDIEMAGYQTTNFGDVNKTGLAITLAATHEIEMDQQRPVNATIGDANPVYEPQLVYYHLATDMRTGRQNLYRQIRAQPGLPTPDEIVAENVAAFTLGYLDKDNNKFKAPEDPVDPADLPSPPYRSGTQYAAGTIPAQYSFGSPPPQVLKDIRRVQVTLTAMPPGATTLAAPATAGATTVTVASTSGFPTSGKFAVFLTSGQTVVGQTVVAYTGKDGTHFTGCTGVPAAATGSVVARPTPIGTVPQPFTLMASVIPQNLPAADEATPDSTPPSVPKGLTVIDNRSCSNKLQVKWDPNPVTEPDLAGYLLFYGPTGSIRIPANQTQVTLNPPDLLITRHADRSSKPNVYAVQILAYDSAGNRSEKSAPVSANPSTDVIVFGGGDDTTANPSKPRPPGGLTVTAAERGLVLSWPATGPDVVGYRLFRSAAPFVSGAHIDGSLQIARETTLPVDETSFTDSNLQACASGQPRTYHYAVASVNCDETLFDETGAAGYHYNSSATLSDFTVASGIPLAKPLPRPDLGGARADEGRVLMTLSNPLADAAPDFDRTEIFWSKSTPAAPAAPPHLDGTTVDGGWHIPDSDIGSPGVFVNRGSRVVVFDRETVADPALSLLPGATYHFLAVSFDSCGTVSDASVVSATIPEPSSCVDEPVGPPPPSFSDPTINSCRPDSVVLGWEYPGKDTVTDLAGFRIVRNPPGVSDPLTAGPTLSHTWVDTSGLEPGGSYTYTISATDCTYENSLLAGLPWPFPPPFYTLSTLILGPVTPGGLRRYEPDFGPGHEFDTANFVTTRSDNMLASDPSTYTYHNNVRFFLQNTSRGAVAIRRIEVAWFNPNVELGSVTIGGGGSLTPEETVPVGRGDVDLTTVTQGAVQTVHYGFITAGDATIAVGSTDGFSPSGQITLGTGGASPRDYRVSYASTDTTHFYGASWASFTAAAGATVRSSTGLETTLTAAAHGRSDSDPAGDDALEVASTAGFPASGQLTVEGIAVSYTGADPTHFLGCSWLGSTSRIAGGNVDVVVQDQAATVGIPSGAVPVTLRFVLPDGRVNRLADMRGESLEISLWTARSLQEGECADPVSLIVDVPRGPELGFFSQSAPGRDGVDSYAVTGQSGTARDTDTKVSSGVGVNVYGTVADHSGALFPDGAGRGFEASKVRVLGISAAAAAAGEVPTYPQTGTPFERQLYSIGCNPGLGGERYAIYQSAPTACGALMPQAADTAHWYYVLAEDKTGNWDRLPNPDYGNYAYFQTAFNVCAYAPGAPSLAGASLMTDGTGITLTWAAPTHYGDTDQTPVASDDNIVFDVYYNKDGTGWYPVLNGRRRSSLRYDHVALDVDDTSLPAGSYRYRVQARNSCYSCAETDCSLCIQSGCCGVCSVESSVIVMP